ncbi:MAG: hypothetical protein IMY71_07910 [Bacteroidetes bacterium]|nr:hypothetical protein [Bacteroidota bacterium]
MKSTKIIRTFVLSVIIGGLLFTVYSCKSRSDKEKTGEKMLLKPAAKEAIKSELKEFIYPLPTSFEVIEMINDLEIGYDIGISNLTENADQYFTEAKKAINLGIYGADLAYASTYQMKQEVMLFLETSRKLADDLGIASIYNEELISEVENSIDKKEKLVDLITDSFYDIYSQLNQNGKANLALLGVAGSWVESLFITTQVSANVYHNIGLVKIIHKQKTSLETLMNILNDNKGDEKIDKIIKELTPLYNIYETVDENLSEKQVNTIVMEVKKIRTQLVTS